MLDRDHRIRTSEFPDFRTPGKMFTGGVLRIKYIPIEGKAKAAVVVGKKSYKTNVERNKFRRRVYAEFGAHIEKLDAMGGVLLVSPLKKVEDITMSMITADISAFVAKNF